MSKQSKQLKKAEHNKMLSILWDLKVKCKDAIEADDPDFSLTDPNGTALLEISNKTSDLYNKVRGNEDLTESERLFAIDLTDSIAFNA